MLEPRRWHSGAFSIFGLRHASAPLKIPQRGCCAFSRNGGRGFTTASCRAQKSAWEPRLWGLRPLVAHVPIFEVAFQRAPGGPAGDFAIGSGVSLWRYQFRAGDGSCSGSCSSKHDLKGIDAKLRACLKSFLQSSTATTAFESDTSRSALTRERVFMSRSRPRRRGPGSAESDDGVDAPRRHLCAKVAVSNCHRRRRPWSKLPRSVWTSRST